MPEWIVRYFYILCVYTCIRFVCCWTVWAQRREPFRTPIFCGSWIIMENIPTLTLIHSCSNCWLLAYLGEMNVAFWVWQAWSSSFFFHWLWLGLLLVTLTFHMDHFKSKVCLSSCPWIQPLLHSEAWREVKWSEKRTFWWLDPIVPLKKQRPSAYQMYKTSSPKKCPSIGERKIFSLRKNGQWMEEKREKQSQNGFLEG